jgi:excisionase family DNA binding protein
MSRTPVKPSQLLSVDETAAVLACSRAHVYRLIAGNQLRSVQIKLSASQRPKTRVRAEDLQAFIDAATRSAS